MMKKRLMEERSQGNHVVMGYEKPSKRGWWFDFGPCKRMQGPWSIECLSAALEIYRLANDKVTIELGRSPIGSMVAMIFRHFLRLEVEAAIVRYPGDENVVAFSSAVNLCQKWKVPFRIYDLKPGQRLQMVVAENKTGRSVILDGDFHRIAFKDGCWNFRLDEAQWRLHGEIARRKLSAVAQFLWWSPELVASFLHDPSIRHLVFNPPYGKEDPTAHVLPMLYHQLNVEWYGGFEFDSASSSETVFIPLGEVMHHLKPYEPRLPENGLPRDFKPVSP